MGAVHMAVANPGRIAYRRCVREESVYAVEAGGAHREMEEEERPPKPPEPKIALAVTWPNQNESNRKIDPYFVCRWTLCYSLSCQK